MQLRGDVADFETIKARILNASHMLVCFPAILMRRRLMHEAMRDTRRHGLLPQLLERDVVPVIQAPAGVSLQDCLDSMLERFANPAVGDQLLTSRPHRPLRTAQLHLHHRHVERENGQPVTTENEFEGRTILVSGAAGGIGGATARHLALAPPVVEASVLSDLRSRIGNFRLVALPAADGWSLGVDTGYLKDLLVTWADDYDWRVVEARVRSLPWVVAGHPNTPLRAVHQRAAADDAATVVLLHGWPDSVMRFEKVLPLLTDVHVVVPALPGYPFAVPTASSGMSAAAMATAVAAAMVDLGYDRYVVSAGDVGTDVAEALATQHPDQVVGLHLTDLSHHHALNNPPADLSAAERLYLERVREWHTVEGGYNHQQSTKPNTLAIGLGDSPGGLAAWIVDKLYRWSDCAGDIETVFTRDDVLNWITAYWVTGTIGTSFAPYAYRELPPGFIDVPTAFTLFPADIVNASREFAARFINVQSWVEASGGGHFDAWERPADYVAGVRAALAHRKL